MLSDSSYLKRHHFFLADGSLTTNQTSKQAPVRRMPKRSDAIVSGYRSLLPHQLVQPRVDKGSKFASSAWRQIRDSTCRSRTIF